MLSHWIKIYIQLKGTLMDVLASHSSLQQKQIFCVLLFLLEFLHNTLFI